MKILVLTSSARVKGNSDLLADEFIRGAQESGHEVEKTGLSRKNIKGCLGCNACQRNTGVCVQKDDAIEIIRKMVDADVVVFATPVYFYHERPDETALVPHICADFRLEGQDRVFHHCRSSRGQVLFRACHRWRETLYRLFRERPAWRLRARPLHDGEG